MSKRVRNLLIMAVALVAVVGVLLAFIFLIPAPTTDDAPQTTPTAPPAPADIVIADKQAVGSTQLSGSYIDAADVVSTVSGVTITNESGSFALTARETDGLLAVSTYHTLPRDTDAIDTLCKHLTYLEAVAKPAITEEESAYGFDAPSAVVDVSYTDGTTETFTFGAQSKGSEGYYCRRAGDDTLYIVSTDIAAQFLVEGKDLIGKVLIAPPSPREDDEEGQAQLLKLQLSGSCREQAVELITDTDASYPGLTYVSTYVITTPYLRAVDSDSFYTVASTMLSLTASGVEMPFPTTEQLEGYGLTGDAHSVAKFTLSVVSTAAAEDGGTVSSHYNDREYMVILGNQSEDGEYYALVDGYDVVYKLSALSVPWAELQYFDLTNKLLFMRDIKTVDTFTVTESGIETTFTLTHHPDKETRDEQLTVTSGGETWSTQDFRVLYQQLLSIHRTADKTEGATASGEPVLRLKMTFNDGAAPTDIALYPMSASRYLLVTSDGEEIAVSISDTDEFIKQYRRYLAGETVESPY